VAKLTIPTFIEHNFSAISFYLFCQGFLINMKATLVWLFHLLDIHEAEHGSNSLPHTVASITSAAHSCLTISSDDIDRLDTCKLGWVTKVWKKAFLKPPSKSNLATTERQEMKIKLKPLWTKTRHPGIKPSRDTFVKQFASNLDLGRDRI
jgi:hypothetical protein